MTQTPQLPKFHPMYLLRSSSCCSVASTCGSARGSKSAFSYSEFQRQLEAGNVRSVSVLPDTLEGELKEAPEGLPSAADALLDEPR